VSSRRGLVEDEEEHHADHGAHQREDDEHPQLFERAGGGLGEQRRAQAAAGLTEVLSMGMEMR
jgi:hypothetical protein